MATLQLVSRWLSPAEIAQKTSLAKTLVRRLLGAVAIQPIRCTKKSQVFRLTVGGRCLALKMHEDPVAFAAELDGYAATAQAQLTPPVLWYQSRHKCFLTPWVRGCESRPRTLEAAAEHLGRLHGALQRSLRGRRLPTLAAVLGAASEPGLTSALDACQRLDRTRSVAVGDVKLDHLLLTETRTYWIDLESFMRGGCQLADLVQLAPFPSQAPIRRRSTRVATEYLDGHAQHCGLDTTPAALAHLLDTFADVSFGQSFAALCH